MDPDDPVLPAVEPAVGKDPAAVGEVLAALAARRRWQSHLAGGDLVGRWADVVGDALAEHTEPVRLKGGVLVVRADSPAWATQVRYLAGELARQVNAALGAETVRQVHVTSGPVSGENRL